MAPLHRPIIGFPEARPAALRGGFFVGITRLPNPLTLENLLTAKMALNRLNLLIRLPAGKQVSKRVIPH